MVLTGGWGSGNFPLQGHLAMSRNIFSCHNWGVAPKLVDRGQGCSTMYRTAQERIIWPQMSRVLSLKNPDLKEINYRKNGNPCVPLRKGEEIQLSSLYSPLFTVIGNKIRKSHFQK